MKPKVAGNQRSRPATPRLSAFATKLVGEWQRLGLPVADATIVIAVSGGADSSALLLAFEELVRNGKLHLTLCVAHLDHALRKSSRGDAQWVKRMAKSLDAGIDVVIGKADLKKPGATNGDGYPANLEQIARNARYKFLHKTAKTKHSSLVLTAHTLDDQAETILMRLLRGSAAEGLSGIVAVRALAPGSDVELIRPLVSWARRADTEDYCKSRTIEFRVDEMNFEETFSRVRVRQHLLPLMKSFNPRIVEALNRTAALLAEDSEALAKAAGHLLEEAGLGGDGPKETSGASLSVKVLVEAPAALRRRALRKWILRERGNLRRVEMVHLLAVEALLKGERGGRVAELPGGLKIVRKRGKLEFSDKVIEKEPAEA